MRYPLTHEDLTEIAKRQKNLERIFFDKDGNYKEASNLISKIVVHRPDDMDDVIGHFVLNDGWLGFEFVEKS